MSEDISKGEELSVENIRVVRPGYGLEPKYLELLIGRKVNRDLIKGDAMSWEYIG